MYIVIDKEKKTIIHINPAPLSQDLTERQIYADYNPDTMQIGKTDAPLPEYWKINEEGYIEELSFQEKVKAKIIPLPPDKKIVNDQLIEKSEKEKYADGLISLEEVREDRIERNATYFKRIINDTNSIFLSLLREKEWNNMDITDIQEKLKNEFLNSVKIYFSMKNLIKDLQDESIFDIDLEKVWRERINYLERLFLEVCESNENPYLTRLPDDPKIE